MPSAARIGRTWYVVFPRTNHESFKCGPWAGNICTVEQPGCCLDDPQWPCPACCQERNRVEVALLSGPFPALPFSMEYEGDLPGLPFCARRGCCFGGWFHPTIVQKPGNPNQAWVFVWFTRDSGPFTHGNYRFEFEGGHLTGSYAPVSGLPDNSIDDVAWVYSGARQSVFFAAVLDVTGGHFRIFESQDGGLTWTPSMWGQEQLQYGSGQAGRPIHMGWLRNFDGSLSTPLTVFWDSYEDHDGDPDTPEKISLAFQTTDPQALPGRMTEFIFGDDLERGGLSGWDRAVDSD